MTPRLYPERKVELTGAAVAVFGAWVIACIMEVAVLTVLLLLRRH